MKAIIIAAGQGSRLWATTEKVPKTLLPFGEGTILSRILGNFAAVGVTEFVVVIGFRGEVIADYLREHRNFGHEVAFVENPQWKRGNGISVLRAESAVGEGTALLSMSDHLVDPAALACVKDAPGNRNLLLTDPRIDEVFDLDDATKVRTEDARIVAIGKDLAEYDALDCGVFRLNARFFAALREQVERGRESISDGAGLLIEQGDFEAVAIPAGARWIDVDTPEAYRHVLARRGDYDRGTPRLASGGPSD